MQNSITLRISELAKSNFSSTFLTVSERFIDSLPVKIVPPNRNKSGYYKFTYGDILEIVTKLSGAAAETFQREERVAVFCKNPFLSILAILTVWESGAAPVMLNYLLTDAEVKEEIALTKSTYVLLDSELPFVDSDKKLFMTDLLEKGKSISGQIDEQASDPEQKAVYIFTSGSTGKPKAVEHTMRSLKAAYDSGNHFLGYFPTDVWLLSLPLFHISGFSVLTRTILSGASLIISESGNVSDIIIALQNHPITICSLVSTQLKKLIDTDVAPPKSLRFSLIGGGRAEVSLLQKAVQAQWQPCAVYGMSETGAFVTVLKPEIINLKKGSAGYLLEGVQINISNDEVETVASGEIGEIGIKSASLFTGYFNNRKESDERIVKGYFQTGDLGYLDAEGFLFVTGRKTDVINSGGEKIHPQEIENALMLLGNIKECCVIGISHPIWGEAVTAAVATIEGESLSENEILKSLYKILPSFKVPKRVIVLPELPKSPLGKISRNKLYAIVESLSVYPENLK
jgi:O-succinylbenzoic acid--CoA ligase